MNFLIGHNQGAGIYKYFQNSWDCLYVDVNPRDKDGSVWASGFNRRVDTLVVIYKDSLESSGGFTEFLLFIPWDFHALHYIRGPSAPSTTSADPRRASTMSAEVRGGSWRSTEVRGGPWGSVEISGSRWRSVEFRVGPRGPRRSLELQKRFEFFFFKCVQIIFFPRTSRNFWRRGLSVNPPDLI